MGFLIWGKAADIWLHGRRTERKLQGDKKGSVRKGKVLRESKGLQQANDRRRTNDIARLKKAECAVVRKAILKEAERIGEEIPALSIWSNHVHVVIGGGGRPVEKVVSCFKIAAYHALRECGFKGRLWTRGYDKRYCFDEKALCAKAAYVERHNLT